MSGGIGDCRAFRQAASMRPNPDGILCLMLDANDKFGRTVGAELALCGRVVSIQAFLGCNRPMGPSSASRFCGSKYSLCTGFPR
jgi:hypothetical protein